MADMKQLVATYADQLVEAQRIGRAQQLKPATQPIHNVVVIGLGGSAFGGEIVRNYVHDRLAVPISIYRGYDVPKYVSGNTLLIASSYSGNTEETLEAAEMARQQGAHVVCVTSGGKLQAWAQQHGFDLVQLPAGYPPRAAAGLSSTQLLYVLRHLGLLGDFDADFAEAEAVVRQFAEQDAAADLARRMKDHAVVLYAADVADSIAIRWRQQINENSKQLCWHHVLPELNHNELVGWEHPKFVLERSLVVYLRVSFEHPQVAKRFELMRRQELLGSRAADIVDVRAKGQGKLAQLTYLLHFGDWVSVLLAEENGEDAAPVKVIDFLKQALTQ